MCKFDSKDDLDSNGLSFRKGLQLCTILYKNLCVLVSDFYFVPRMFKILGLFNYEIDQKNLETNRWRKI